MSCHGDPAHLRSTQSAPARDLLPVKTIDDGPRTLMADMIAQMDDDRGIGLAD